jgi:hypothetical protein
MSKPPYGYGIRPDPPGHEWGPSVTALNGHRLTVRPFEYHVWVICEATRGVVDHPRVHGFVRRVGDVWEVACTTTPLSRCYVGAQHDVMSALLVRHHEPLALPRQAAADRRGRDAWSDDELGVVTRRRAAQWWHRGVARRATAHLASS